MLTSNSVCTSTTNGFFRTAAAIVTSTRNLVGVVSLAAAFLCPTPAHAEEIFPAVIAKDANLPCVPTCTLCHTTNPGAKGTWVGKKFGSFIGTHGATFGDASSVTTAFAAYKADATNAAGVLALQQGLDPDTGESLCGPTYGCGARVAKKAPPAGSSAPLWVIGLAVAGALLRRRGTPPSSG